MVSSAERERLLLDCLCARGEAVIFERLRVLSESEWRELLGLAAELMVAPMLWHRLLSAEFEGLVPAHVRHAVAAEQRRVTLVNLRIHADFRRVVLALHAGGVPVIALKGLHLASLVYHDLAIRTMGDIDLLVHAPDLVSAGRVLQELGYHPLSPYVVTDPYHRHHLPRFVTSTGATNVEIHWHLIDADGAPSTLVLDIDGLWDRAVWERVAGVAVQVLCPEDSLLHQCIHATYAHLCEFSVRPWCDIAATIREYGHSLVWETVTARAARWGCRRGAYLALRLARDLVDADVPDEVLQSLRPVDFDERILMLASRQRHRVRLPVPIARVGQQHGLLGKLRACWRRVLLPKDALADVYNLPRSSRLLYPFYLIRLTDLIKHHWRTVVRLSGPQARLTTLEADTVALLNFLGGE